MFFIKYYVFELLIFFMLLMSTNAMANPIKEKHQQNAARSERQFRPIFNGLIFLLAANLVAKGALGLGAYQGSTIPNNIQGSLVLSINNPQGPVSHPTPSPYVSYQPILFPLHTHIPHFNNDGTTKRPVVPVTQHQVVNILDPFLDSIDKYGNEENVEELPQQHIVINKFNRVEDLHEPYKMSNKQDRQLKETETEDPNILEQTDSIETLDEDLSQTNDSNITDSERQASTMMPTTRNMTIATTIMTPTTSATTMATPVTVTSATNATAMNTTVGYGPSNGNENVSITNAPPMDGFNTTRNVSQMLQPPPGGNNTSTPETSNAGVYNYYPNIDYGPYTGNENISITYGLPVYQKPFFSSPEDTFLNSQNQQSYGNYPATYYNQFSDFYKYNDILNRFYNNYNYPSFYSNYLNKQVF